VARVAATEITRSTLHRWMVALAPEHSVPDAPDYIACVKRDRSLGLPLSSRALKVECQTLHQELQRKALDLLISSYWLAGAAAELGVRPAAREVRQRASGITATTGLTGKDAELRARAELSASAARHVLSARIRPITRNDALAYYRTHIRRFQRQELRYVDLAENFPTREAASRARIEVEAGKRLASISLHEVLERFNTTGRTDTRLAAEDAIFAARAHVLSGPVRLTAQYAIFEVTRIVRPRRESFSHAESAIRRELAAELRRSSLNAFIQSWRRRWIGRTSCAPGYVIDRCVQYHGAARADWTLALE
jgi:hypothetical protein